MSGSLDAPEGGSDAVMQAITCEVCNYSLYIPKIIGNSNRSRKNMMQNNVLYFKYQTDNAVEFIFFHICKLKHKHLILQPVNFVLINL